MKSSTKMPSIKEELHKRLEHVRPVRHNMEFVHASQLTDENKTFCPREVRILDAIAGKTLKQQKIEASLNYTFTLGRHVEQIFREVMGTLMVGDWRCLNCVSMYRFCKKPEVCHACGGEEFDYYEPLFVSKDEGITCSVDCLLDLGEDKFVMVEIKSMDKDIFKKLVSPLSEHRDRTNLYMRGVDTSGGERAKYINTKQARVLYMGKCFGMKHSHDSHQLKLNSMMSPFKEYVVERDDSVLKTHLLKSKVVKKARESGKYPKGICSTSICSRAMKCPVADKCFSGQFPREEIEI